MRTKRKPLLRLTMRRPKARRRIFHWIAWVNLADPGGEKVAQVGVTLELLDVSSPEKVKAYLPAIRSGILLLISQRTAEELLQREGKEQLAAAILEDASRYFKPAPGEKGTGKSKKKDGKSAEDENPVRGVLFSSFIVQ